MNQENDSFFIKLIGFVGMGFMIYMFISLIFGVKKGGDNKQTKTKSNIEIGEVFIDSYPNNSYHTYNCFLLRVNIYSEIDQWVYVEGLGTYGSLVPSGCGGSLNGLPINNGKVRLVSGSNTYAAYSNMGGGATIIIKKTN